MPQAITLGDGDLSRENNEHAGTDLAALEQQLAVLMLTHLAKPAHAADLCLRQLRKRLLESRETLRRGGR